MKYVKLFENWLNEAENKVKPFDPKNPWSTSLLDISAKDVYNLFYTKGADLKLAEDVMNRILTSIYLKSDGNEKELKKTEFDGSAMAFTFKYKPNEKDYKGKRYITFTLADGTEAILKEDSWSHWGMDEDNLEKLDQSGIGFVITDQGSTNQTITRKHKGDIHLSPKNTDTFLFPNGGVQDESKIAITSCNYTVFRLFPTLGPPVEKSPLFNALAYASRDDSKALLGKGEPSLADLGNYFGYTIPDNYTPKQGGIKKIKK